MNPVPYIKTLGKNTVVIDRYDAQLATLILEFISINSQIGFKITYDKSEFKIFFYQDGHEFDMPTKIQDCIYFLNCNWTI